MNKIDRFCLILNTISALLFLAAFGFQIATIFKLEEANENMRRANAAFSKIYTKKPFKEWK